MNTFMENIKKNVHLSNKHVIPGNIAPERLYQGECAKIMGSMPSSSIDLIVTDPPYVVGYRDRDNRTLKGDTTDAWMFPSFWQMYRLLKPDSFMVSFYGWSHVEKFMELWKHAGFRPVGHIVWHKRYASKTGYLNAKHEQAYVLAKGNPKEPAFPLNDVRSWVYSGNKHHPTEKHPFVLQPLITAFSKPGDVVLDPFAGSGSTGIASSMTKRQFIGIEKDKQYFDIATKRLKEELST
jgi:adenine-specific DNA-methyltransferase